MSTGVTVQHVRNCFSVVTLSEWSEKYPGLKDAIEKRIDVISTMGFRARDRAKCTPQQKKELDLFEEQYKKKKQRDKEIEREMEEAMKAKEAAKVHW